MSSDEVTKYPALVTTTRIAIDGNTELRFRLDPYDQKFMVLKEERSWYHDNFKFKQACNMAVYGEHTRDIGRIISVEEYIETIGKFKDIVKNPRIVDPKLFLTPGFTTMEATVVDMTNTNPKWGGAFTGVNICWDNDSINLERSSLNSETVLEYPYKNLYLTGTQLGIPYAFVYPTMKAFMDVCLADPYYFKERKSLTLRIRDLHTMEDRFTIDPVKLTVIAKSPKAEYALALERIKSI